MTTTVMKIIPKIDHIINISESIQAEEISVTCYKWFILSCVIIITIVSKTLYR